MAGIAVRGGEGSGESVSGGAVVMEGIEADEGEEGSSAPLSVSRGERVEEEYSLRSLLEDAREGGKQMIGLTKEGRVIRRASMSSVSPRHRSRNRML